MTASALNGPVVAALAGVAAILALATSATAVARRLHESTTLADIACRVRTWWAMAALFGPAVVLGGDAAIAFFAVVSFLALREYLSIVPTRRADRHAVLIAYLTIPIQYWLIHRQWYGMFLVFIPVYAGLLLPARLVIAGETAGFLRSVGVLQWGLMLTVFGVSHIAFLATLPALPELHSGGAGLVLFLVLLTEGNDIAQYLWGKSLGRRRIAPRVSPNKTWAGFLGGLATTIALGSLLGPWLAWLPRPQAIVAAVIIGVGGFAGDLVVSALKRDLGVKDCGTMLPGHGGILDRIDSLTYTAPLFFHYVHFLQAGCLQWTF